MSSVLYMSQIYAPGWYWAVSDKPAFDRMWHGPYSTQSDAIKARIQGTKRNKG